MTKELTDIQAAELLGLGYRGGRSIGDMIEFLGDRFYSINTLEKDGKRQGFMVSFKGESLKHAALPGWQSELINALFEAVKGVLG